MKPNPILVMFFCAFGQACAIGSPVSGQECKIDVSSNSRVITSVGTAMVQAVPDRVLVAFDVRVAGKDVTAASTEIDARTKKLLAVVASLQVPSENVHVSKLKIVSRCNDSWSKSDSTPTGFALTKRIGLHLANSNELENVLKSVLAAGVSDIEWIQFDLSDSAKPRDDARVLAVRAAREKAEAMASELKQKLGKVLLIKELPNTAEPSAKISGSNLFQVAPRIVTEGGQNEFAVDSVSISSSVTATFELID